MEAVKEQVGGGVKPRRDQKPTGARVAVNEGFIRGGFPGGTVRIEQIMPAHLRTFSTAAQQEAIAQQYEHVHGVAVLRAGEREDDPAVQKRIEAMSEQKPAKEQPAQGMSKLRAKPLLDKLRRQYAESRVQKEREALRREINGLERLLEIPETNFAKGEARSQVQQAEEPIPPAVQKKLNLYAEGTKRQKERVLEKDLDTTFLKAVKETESDPDLLAITVRRLTEAGEI